MHEHRDPPSGIDAPAPPLARAAGAELVGSFIVVLVGAGSVCVAGSGGAGLAGVALATGFAFGAALTMTAPLSGGGLNPALTAGFWVAGRLSSERAGAYVVAQLVGAILAGLVLRFAVPHAMWQPASLGAPLVIEDIGAGRAVLIEAAVTFVLTVVAFGLLIDDRVGAGAAAGVVLGTLVAALTFVAWPLTGAALNPARALGPELAGGTWTDWWVYWIGPAAGGVVGAVGYWSLFLRDAAAGASDRPST